MFSRLGHDLKYEYIEAVTEAADVDGDGTITFKGIELAYYIITYYNDIDFSCCVTFSDFVTALSECKGPGQD